MFAVKETNYSFIDRLACLAYNFKSQYKFVDGSHELQIFNKLHNVCITALKLKTIIIQELIIF